MKLKEYAALVAKLAKKHPDFDVVYAQDEEGNGYDYVFFGPTLGRFEDSEFTNEGPKSKFNAVCIN